MLASSLLYLLGDTLVTMKFNTPINEVLDTVEPESAAAVSVWARLAAGRVGTRCAWQPLYWEQQRFFLRSRSKEARRPPS